MPSQTNFRFTFAPLAGSAEFEVVSFTLEESVSTPFQLTLELSCDQHVDFGDVLDKPGLFTLWNDLQPVRYVHGVVSSFSHEKSGVHRTFYRAVVEPQLARARLRSNWRIFQHRTVPQILEQILQRQGITRFELITTLDHPVREFCVQAGETDFDFFARLAAEEGFVYRFAHTAESHTLIISDRLQSMGTLVRGDIRSSDNAPIPPDRDSPDAAYTVLFHQVDQGRAQRPCLHTLHYGEHVRSARQAQRDYTFTHPAYRQDQRACAPAMALEHQSSDYERFDYPGRYKRDIVGRPFTENRLRAWRHDACLAHVEGDDVRLQPGLGFTLCEHPRDDFNVHWRVISASHCGKQSTILQEEAAGAEHGTHYQQTATLVPGLTEWRPAPLPKPHVDGPHMATVVGPAGEEIYCDQWGRVKVSFPWDRESRDDEHSSCWIRVAQSWAGGSWGAMAIPRIGNDVIIHYVNGDPDQPMITGRTYCGNQLPPYDLPEHKTRMTLKSKTHKGSGFNELRFEDEQGRQEVFIHAERDQNNVVKHDETTSVGNDRREQVQRNEQISIGQDRAEDVGRDEHVRIGQNRAHEIANDCHLNIGRTHTIVTGLDRIESIGNHRQDTIKANHSVEIGGHLEHTVAGHTALRSAQAIRHTTKTYEIEVSESLTIRSPAGLLRIDGAGITLDGVSLQLKGPLDHAANSTQHSISLAGVPEPGEAVCLSCLRKAIAEGRNLIRMEGGL